MATIYFDLDGTLVDCRERHFGLYSEICHQLGIAPLSSRRYWTLRRQGASSPSLIQGSDRTKSEFAKLWLERIESPECVALDRPFPGVTRTLERLKRAHNIVLVTLRHREEVLLAQLENLGLRRHLGAVVCPNGRAIESKADLIEEPAAAGEAFVVGDSEADIALARDLKATAICVSSGVRGRKYLENAGADYVIDGIGALPRIIHK